MFVCQAQEAMVSHPRVHTLLECIAGVRREPRRGMIAFSVDTILELSNANQITLVRKTKSVKEI